MEVELVAWPPNHYNTHMCSECVKTKLVQVGADMRGDPIKQRLACPETIIVANPY